MLESYTLSYNPQSEKGQKEAHKHFLALLLIWG